MYTLTHKKTTGTTKQTIYRVNGFVDEPNANADYYPFPEHPEHFGNPIYATSEEAFDDLDGDKGYLLYFYASDVAAISKGATAFFIAGASDGVYDKNTKFE
jgi:hypothetical protein